MKFPSRITTLAMLLALIGGIGLAGCGKSQPEGAQNAAPPAVEVGVVKVGLQAVALDTELPGRTSPYQIAEVRPQVGGILQKRLFEEGSDIKAGQVLYQIDPATYQAEYESAKAALAKAEANVLTARNRASRYDDLVAINAVSKQDHDDATATLKQVEADVAGAKAALETARINLAYTSVTSPISGRIGRSTVTAGALVTANQAQALATVQQLDPIYVDVTQSTTELMRLRRDLESGRLKQAGGKARVQLVLEDGSHYAQEGRLEFSDVTVDQTTGNVTLRAVFPNPKHQLLPGMYVRAVLEEGVNESAILVPQQGVTRDARGVAVAMIVNAEGKVEPRQLKTERTVGDQWLVSDGLNAGDQVIVEGLQKVRPGVPAHAVPVQPKAGAASAPAAKQGA
ncbi:efflux RND transporter periplasmic adaptor subunit [Chitiniphilus eburneus]|uniref:Efflux RND transporter periplasmic adaptor subunit n=1 Tax=Chitiniphilus eburneus TaxID=2571148 RepID=A0A4V5MNE6_9NEIS|nr:efflux RND transporter periplasmic adaptor subunit [Chitiniphilus eburneus]TJZ64498.1 efflux RND transporter periplasmic adaptor subunit [Chitiniphilus eburneus]